MVRLVPSGDTALVVEFGDTVDRELNARVLALARRLGAAQIPGVVEQVPTFRSLMVHYDPVRLLFKDLCGEVERLLAGLEPEARAGRVFTLPVCYGGDLGPDLENVARVKGMTPEEVVRRHAAVTYNVYCIGFMPGLAYMGDSDARLELPRLETPRVRVPMGSVSIAMRQTVIYPLESPGGWHLLGRTPVRLFDLRRENAALLEPGDQVRFEPVPRARYDALEAMAAAGTLDVVETTP